MRVIINSFFVNTTCTKIISEIPTENSVCSKILWLIISKMMLVSKLCENILY